MVELLDLGKNMDRAFLKEQFDSYDLNKNGLLEEDELMKLQDMLMNQKEEQDEMEEQKEE